MQQDVLDGVAWVKEQQLADVDDSCVVGWSYGGYVSLFAATNTPTQFNCYVSIAGVSDINAIAEIPEPAKRLKWLTISWSVIVIASRAKRI